MNITQTDQERAAWRAETIRLARQVREDKLQAKAERVARRWSLLLPGLSGGVMTSEPIYTYDGFVLAGSHPRNGRTYRVTDREIVSTTGLHSVVGTTNVVALPERETLAVAADMVRRACDITTMSRGQLRRAMTETCAMLHHPDESVYRSAAMSLGIGSGDVDAVMSSADPWQARQHEVKVTRSRKGVTSFKRTKVAMAVVTGGTHAVPPADPDAASSDAACLARDRAVLSLMGARKMACGTNALDVQRSVDLHYRRLGLPSLEGSDSTSWARVVNGGIGSSVATASHRAGIDGTASRSLVNVLAAYGDEYATHTATVAVWPVRGDQTTGSKSTTLKMNGQIDQKFGLPMGHVRSEDPTDTRTFVVAPDGEITSVWSLVAPNDRPMVRTEIDHDIKRGPRVIVKRSSLRALPARRWTVRNNVLTYAPRSNSSLELERMYGRNATAEHAVTRWSGHKVVDRPGVKREARKTSAKRARSVDIGTVTAPTTASGWSELLDNLNRGEKLTARDDHGTVKVSRNARGYVATDTRNGESVKWESRTASGIAERLATA